MESTDEIKHTSAQSEVVHPEGNNAFVLFIVTIASASVSLMISADTAIVVPGRPFTVSELNKRTENKPVSRIGEDPVPLRRLSISKLISLPRSNHPCFAFTMPLVSIRNAIFGAGP